MLTAFLQIYVVNEIIYLVRYGFDKDTALVPRGEIETHVGLLDIYGIGLAILENISKIGKISNAVDGDERRYYNTLRDLGFEGHDHFQKNARLIVYKQMDEEENFLVPSVRRGKKIVNFNFLNDVPVDISDPKVLGKQFLNVLSLCK